MFLTKFLRKNLQTNNIMIFHLLDCADKCRGWIWRFPITGSSKFVTPLSTNLSSNS
jgi:hypothetical protein